MMNMIRNSEYDNKKNKLKSLINDRNLETE